MNCPKCACQMVPSTQEPYLMCPDCGKKGAPGTDPIKVTPWSSAPAWGYPRCECGAEGMGVKGHSSWCPRDKE